MDKLDMDESVTQLDEHRRPKGESSQYSRVKDPGSLIRRLVCFPEVDTMVREGKYLREIVTHIREFRGELTDMSQRAVSYLVKDYRDSIYSTDIGEIVPRPRSGSDEEDPFYELYELQKYFKLLTERIDMEVATEKNLTKLFSTTHKEFLTLKQIAESILAEKDKRGLLNAERGGQRQRVGSGMPGRIDIAEVIANPESRHRVMGLVETLIADPDLLDTLSDSYQPKASVGRKNRPKRKKK